MRKPTNSLFFDMDGTMFKFKDCEEGAWNTPGFFKDMMPHVAVCRAIDALAYSYRDNIYVLTATPEHLWAREEKLEMCRHCIPNVVEDHIILAPLGTPKPLAVPQGVSQRTYLVDDFTRNLVDWGSAGGVPVKCITSRNNRRNIWEGEAIYADDAACTTYTRLRGLLERENV